MELGRALKPTVVVFVRLSSARRLPRDRARTAARYGRPIIVAVLDDQKWAAIAIPQRRVSGGDIEMELPRRDWVKVAEGWEGTAPLQGPGMRSAAQSTKLSKPPGNTQTRGPIVYFYMAYISR